MITEQIAKAIEKSGVSRYRIWKDTEIDQSVLCRLMHGGRCSMATAEKLCEYLGLEVEIKPKRKRG